MKQPVDVLPVRSTTSWQYGVLSVKPAVLVGFVQLNAYGLSNFEWTLGRATSHWSSVNVRALRGSRITGGSDLTFASVASCIGVSLESMTWIGGHFADRI